jgi:hypothetical protein
VLAAEDRVALGHEGPSCREWPTPGTDRGGSPRASAAITNSHTESAPTLTETSNRPVGTPPPRCPARTEPARRQQDAPPSICGNEVLPRFRTGIQ